MQELTWWQTAVFYQIFPRSYADGNGDGIGDILRFDLDARTLRLVFSSHTGDGDLDNLSQLSIAPFRIYVAELI